MKKFLLFIFLSLLFLSGVRNGNDSLQRKEWREVENVFHADISDDYVQCSVTDLPDEGEPSVETKSLARQYRVCGRGYRPFSMLSHFLGKNSTYQAARKHLEMLCHTINCVYTSLPFQCWTVSSEHYIFGMRRILI